MTSRPGRPRLVRHDSGPTDQWHDGGQSLDEPGCGDGDQDDPDVVTLPYALSRKEEQGEPASGLN